MIDNGAMSDFQVVAQLQGIPYGSFGNVLMADVLSNYC